MYIPLAGRGTSRTFFSPTAQPYPPLVLSTSYSVIFNHPRSALYLISCYTILTCSCPFYESPCTYTYTHAPLVPPLIVTLNLSNHPFFATSCPLLYSQCLASDFKLHLKTQVSSIHTHSIKIPAPTSRISSSFMFLTMAALYCIL